MKRRGFLAAVIGWLAAACDVKLPVRHPVRRWTGGAPAIQQVSGNTRVWVGGSKLIADWGDPRNWSGGIAPVNGDHVVFDDSCSEVRFAPDDAMQLDSLTIGPKFTGCIARTDCFPRPITRTAEKPCAT